MRTRTVTIGVVLTILVCLVGCTGGAKFPSYYTLNVPPPADPPKPVEKQDSVAVREFSAPAYLRQGALVYRPSPEVVGFYHYHRWAVDPREVLTQAVVDRLRRSGNFNVVKIYDGRSDVDFVLVGRLDRLEEVDAGRQISVQVALSAEMTDLRSGKTVWSNSASEVAEVENRSVPGVVNGMSQALDRAIRTLVSSLPDSK